MGNTVIQYLDTINILVMNHLTGEKKQDYINSIADIYQKAKSRKLHLAVVGEFNSGKSTFINAFLRKPLLKAACKATTASSTFIEKGNSEFSLSAKINNNKFTASNTNFSALQKEVRKYQKSNHPPGTLYEILHCLTSEQAVANYVEEIHIHIPDDHLPDNVIIIDTPGINPGDELAINHHAITKNVVEKIADMAMVLIPAHAAMSHTLENFLAESLHRCLHRCIFVVTAMDNIEPQHRDDVIQFVTRRLKKHLKIQNPTVFYQSAITVLPVQRIPESKKNEWEHWQNLFRNFEKITWERLSRQKHIVISEHLYFLLDNLLSELKRDLEEKKKELQATKRVLSNSRLSDIEQLTARLLDEVKLKIETRYNTVNFSTDSYQTRSILKCNTIIEQGGKLKNFAEQEAVEIEDYLQRQAKNYIKNINKQLEEFSSLCDEITQRFEAEFKKHYSNFPLLSSDIQIGNIRKKITIPDIEFDHIISNIAKENNDDDNAKTGVIGTAAIIGGIVGLGPVGALIGAGIGYVISWFLPENTDKIQMEAKEKIGKGINKFFNGLKKEVKKNARNLHLSIHSQFNKICDNHIREYGNKVASLIRRQEENEKRLAKEIAAIQKEIVTLETLEDEIKNKRMELKIK